MLHGSFSTTFLTILFVLVFLGGIGAYVYHVNANSESGPARKKITSVKKERRLQMEAKQKAPKLIS